MPTACHTWKQKFWLSWAVHKFEWSAQSRQFTLFEATVIPWHSATWLLWQLNIEAQLMQNVQNRLFPASY